MKEETPLTILLLNHLFLASSLLSGLGDLTGTTLVSLDNTKSHVSH